MPVEHFYVPWPSGEVHWTAELVRNGVTQFEGADSGRVLMMFDDDTKAAMAALALPADAETLWSNPHCGLLLPTGADVDFFVGELREGGHTFGTLEVVVVDAGPDTLHDIERVLAALVARKS